MFNHEKFEAYQLSLDHWEKALVIMGKIPTGSFVLKDQLKRASSSISLNIAEACGRVEKRDRKRFLSIARGSAMECAAIFDLILKVEPNLLDEIKYSKEKLLSIVRILSVVIMK